MRRDMDLIREILLKIADAPEPAPPITSIEEYDDSTVRYHLALLRQAGYISNPDRRTPLHGGTGVYLTGNFYWLTWEGQEFLETVIDQDRWDKIKEQLCKAGGFTMPIIRELGIDLLKKQVGLK